MKYVCKNHVPDLGQCTIQQTKLYHITPCTMPLKDEVLELKVCKEISIHRARLHAPL